MSDQTPSPFSSNGWNTEPTIIKEAEATPEVITDTQVADVVKDPVIKEKDEKIKEDEIIDDKTDKPEAVPAATPKDIPEKAKEEGKPTSEIKLNETSEKIYNLLVEGKEDEIFPILNQRQILKNLDKLPAAEVLKLKIRNENQDIYSQQDVDDIFNELYSLPEKPEQGLGELDTDFEAREDKYKEQLARAERRIERESKTAKTSLAAQLQELVLPNIQKTPDIVEPTQEELDRLNKQRENFLQAVDGSLKDLNAYSATFKDEEVEIPVAYAVTKQEKDNLRPLLDSLNTDLPQFFTQLDWFDKDGKLNTNKVVSDLHLIQNKDAVIQKFVNEAGNKRYAEAVKRQKNVDFTSTARRGNLEPSVQEEVDKKVKSFFAAS